MNESGYFIFYLRGLEHIGIQQYYLVLDKKGGLHHTDRYHYGFTTGYFKHNDKGLITLYSNYKYRIDDIQLRATLFNLKGIPHTYYYNDNTGFRIFNIEVERVKHVYSCYG